MTYSSSLSMSRQRYSSRNQNTTSFQNREKTLGPVSNTIMLLVLGCVLGLLYLTQVTKTNAYSYKIDSLQTQQTELKEKNADLEVASARMQSLERIKNSEVVKALVAVAPNATLQN